MSNAIVCVQLLPAAKDQTQSHAFVDQAIAIIRESGVAYEVGALGTTMQGALHTLLAIVEQLCTTVVHFGAPYTLANVQVYFHPEGASIKQFVEKHR
ncbi:MAG: thiamine-binding protein [Paenibacillaceae bacterium]|nr:thiamine-binding protein [Paenibacillaceae bacterium]